MNGQTFKLGELKWSTFDQNSGEVQPFPFEFIFGPPPKSSLSVVVDFVPHAYFIDPIDFWIE